MAKKKRKKASEMTWLDRLRDRWANAGGPARLALPWAGATLALGGLGFGAVVADARGVEIVAERSPVVEIVWPDGASGWSMPEVERRRLLALCAQDAGERIGLSAAPLASLARTLDETNWFRAMPTVRRVGESASLVEGDWRVPAAVLRVGARERLISWDGVALPLEYPAGQSSIRYIAGVSTSGSAESRAAEVKRALTLMELLAGSREVYAQVAGIDMGLGGTVEILTDRGTRIVWGGAPGRTRPGEQPIEVRTERLRSMVQRFGRIDANASIVEIHGAQVLVDRQSGG